MKLGHTFRETLYPGVGSEVGGGGLLRLHSTFRHDLKIKTSDEVRCNQSRSSSTKVSVHDIFMLLTRNNYGELLSYTGASHEDSSCIC